MNNKEESFYTWLKRQKYTNILTILCAILPIILPEIFDYFSKGQNTIGDIFNYSSNLYNIFFILIALCLITNSKFLLNQEEDKSHRLYQYVKEQLGENCKMVQFGEKMIFHRMKVSFKQFYYSWLTIWSIWLVLYIGKFFFFISGFDCDYQHQLYECIFENILNLLNSFTFFFIYMVITITTVETTYKENNCGELHTGVICIMFVGTILILSNFYFMHTNAQPYTIFTILLVTGIIASMSLTAVLGRLNSNYLGIPQWLIIGLYFYAALQVTYPINFIDEIVEGRKEQELVPIWDDIKSYSNTISLIFYGLAFTGKILLLLLVKWIMSRKRFLFFLIHKANSMIESKEMLQTFNKSYDPEQETEIKL